MIQLTTPSLPILFNTRPVWLLFLWVVRPPLFWHWERPTYPSRSCNVHNGPKGPKFKQKKNHLPIRSSRLFLLNGPQHIFIVNRCVHWQMTILNTRSSTDVERSCEFHENNSPCHMNLGHSKMLRLAMSSCF